MTDIRLFAMTVDARRVALADADVMQHRRLFEELAVQFQFRMFFRNQQAAIRHLPTVNDKESPEFIVLRIVLVDYFLIIHILFLWHGFHGFNELKTRLVAKKSSVSL
jgi:hypothetical protein